MTIEIEATIAAKEMELESLRLRLPELKARGVEINAEMESARAEFNAKMDGLRKIKEAVREEIYDIQKLMRRLVTEIEALKNQLIIDLENLAKTKTFIDNALVFSKRIAEHSYDAKILPHQKEGACILANSSRAILGDKRGLGKTLTVIATLDALQAQRVLVIAPDDVVSNFVNELSRWAPHRTIVPMAKLDKTSRELLFGMVETLDQVVVAINYSAWRKDKSLVKKLADLRFDTVICDEAHELKNTRTMAFKGVRDIVMAENSCPMCDAATCSAMEVDYPFNKYAACRKCDWTSLSEEYSWERKDRCSVKNVYPMTGTVILNKPVDLFALLHLVDPDLFDSPKTFLTMYCYNPYGSTWQFKPGGLDRLTGNLSGKYLARDESTAGVVRPKQSIVIHEMEMDTETYPLQSLVINQLTEHAEIILDSGKVSTLETITLILRKRQANVWPAGINVKVDGEIVFSVGDDVQESIKLDKIIKSADEGMIPEFTENGSKELGSRVVVFSQFKDPLIELEARCRKAGITVARLDGDTKDATRNEIKLDFDRYFCETDGYNNGEGYRWQVLLCNYKTGGAGLNFNSATESIFLDEEWSPGKADQATGRTDRMGQTEENNVHILRLNKSIDTWMVKLNQDKQNMIEGFESAANGSADALLLAMRNGDII